MQPTLTSARLVLRPFFQSDCDAVTLLAGEREIAEMTALVPHPYARSDAEAWISGHAAAFDSGKSAEWAIVRASDACLIGAIGAVFSANHNRADFGYWIGKPFWNKGFATEAGRRLVQHLFDDRGLIRVAAFHFTKNPASGRVLQKIGLTNEGLFRKHIRKWGEYEDCVMYGLVRDDWKR